MGAENLHGTGGGGFEYHLADTCLSCLWPVDALLNLTTLRRIALVLAYVEFHHSKLSAVEC